ncbi:MAG: radical SAM family heme chaperone HemW [Gemmatimonadota bacterium]|nr:radical SAM family heme chaperone HemW [Gemmatimonadota bacterium]
MSGAQPPRPRGVYVHVPFCARRCHYCDFSVARARHLPIGDYLAALEEDLRQWFSGPDDACPVPIDTLFIGGGTPSLLGVDGMAALSDLLRTRFSWDADRVEWTAEANPNSLSVEVAVGWRKLGVNRLSLGVQSFQAEPLDWLGRLHDPREAEQAVRTAIRAGFDRLNVDLIFGLPADVRRSWSQDVERAVELGVSHISSYGLTAEPRTPLGRWVDVGRVRMPGDGRYADEYLEASAILVAAGFEHYEVSNYARPGHASRHNWLYWDGSEYLGVGPSAHSYLDGERIWNVFGWDRYLQAAVEGRSVREGRERLEPDQRRLERVWLDLRTTRGLDPADVTGPVAQARLAAWRAEGWVTDDARPRLAPAGWLRLDALAAEVAEWSDGGQSSGIGSRD